MKVINNIRHNNKLQIILIQLIFIILAVAFVITPIIQNRVISQNDTIFNYQRVMEVFKQISHFRIPQFNLYTTLPYGGATPSMYPWIILVPLTPLSLFIHNSLILWEVITSIGILMGFEVGFYAFKTWQPKNLNAFLFAIIYTLSTIEINFIVISSDVGSLYATLLAPLVLFGWLQWLKDGRWKMMTIGLILMLYSHLLSTVIMLVALIALTIVCGFHTKNKKYKLFQLTKGIISSIMATCVIWEPIFIIFKNNSLTPPTTSLIRANKLAPVIPNNLSYIIAPFLYRIWTFSDLIGLILAIIYWKRLSNLSKKFTVISIGCLLMNTYWIKMFLMTKTPIGQIQFMYRIGFISHLLLSYVFVEIIINILLKRWYIQNVLTLLIMLFVVMQVSVIVSDLAPTKLSTQSPNQFFKAVAKVDIHSEKKDVDISNNLRKIVFCSKNINTSQFLHYNSRYDYLPLHMAFHYGLTDKGELANRHPYNVYPKSNGKIRFHLKQNNHKILIPMTMYCKQKYHVKLDRHPANWQFNKKFGCVQLNNVKAGWHTAQLQIPIMNYRYQILFVTLAGLGLLISLKSRKESLLEIN